MTTLFLPLTTETDQAVRAAAAAAGLTVDKLHTNLYEIRGTWCPVILSHRCGRWVVSRHALANRYRRWRKIYQGPRLATAMAKAAGYKERDQR